MSVSLNIDGQYLINGVPVGGGGLSGTNYLFVSADGLPTENAQTLQDAYITAKAMNPNGVPKSASNRVTIYISAGYYDFSAIAVGTFDVAESFIDLVSLSGQMDVIFYTPIYVHDASGLGEQDVRIVGIDVTNNGANNIPFIVISSGGNNENIQIKNCRGADYSFSCFSSGFRGQYENCIGGNYSFCSLPNISPTAIYYWIVGTGSNNIQVFGNFVNCISRGNSFGYVDMDVSGSVCQTYGDMRNCVAESSSFICAGDLAQNNGIIDNCMVKSGSNFCFCASPSSTGLGTGSGVNNGTISNCRSYGSSFCYASSGSMNGAVNFGNIIYCVDLGGVGSFCINDTFLMGKNFGTIEYCTTDSSGFCGDNGENYATFSYCKSVNGGFCFNAPNNNFGNITYCCTYTNFNLSITANVNSYYLCRASNTSVDF